jgi:hypothetical protein
MENDGGAVGKGAAGRYAGNEDTLLDPEKTSAGDGLGFSGKTIDHACEANRSLCGG